MEDVENNLSSVVVTFAVGAVFLLIWLVYSVMGKAADDSNVAEVPTTVKPVKNGKHSAPQKKKKLPEQPSKKSKKDPQYSHPWLCRSFDAHKTAILDMDLSPNGKYLVTCADDRTLHIVTFKNKDLLNKDNRINNANVSFDYAKMVKFSPDSKAIVMLLENRDTIGVMKMGKKEDGSLGNFQTALEFPTDHQAEIVSMGIASSGRFIMTCDSKTTINIWDIKGTKLATINTNLMINSYATVSSCGRFVAACGFTTDVKVWQIVFTRAGEYKEVCRAFDLKGHSAGVYSCAFSGDSFRMVSISKDGTWRLWDTNVEFELNQDPKELSRGKFTLPPEGKTALVGLSPDARTVTVIIATEVHVYDAMTGELKQTISKPHNGNVSAVLFDDTNRFLLTCGSRRIHIFHNVVGLQATLPDLESKLSKTKNDAAKNSLLQQIGSTKKALAAAGIEM